MKRTAATILALTALIAPANALTLQQAYNELAGMFCSGSTCTRSTTVNTTVDNPDIVTSTEVLVSPGTSQDAPNTSMQSFGHCPPMATMNGGTIARTNVNADCTALSLNPGSGGSPAVYRADVTVTDGGTTIVTTCTTTSKTLSYNGPNTSRDTAWSVTSATSSTDGAC